MKKALLLVFLMMFMYTLVDAQVRIGIRGGINTLQIDKNSSVGAVGQLADQITGLAVEQTQPGIAAGVLVQVKVWKILVQPEVLFSQTRLSYNVNYLDPMSIQNTINEVKSEKSQYIDIPVLIGTRLGPVRLHVGPEAHIFVNSISELVEFDDYEEKFQTATWSWVADVGIDFRKFLFDVRYEGNFSAIGDQFVIGGESFSFDKTPGRWVFTAGFYF